MSFREDLIQLFASYKQGETNHLEFANKLCDCLNQISPDPMDPDFVYRCFGFYTPTPELFLNRVIGYGARLDFTKSLRFSERLMLYFPELFFKELQQKKVINN